MNPDQVFALLMIGLVTGAWAGFETGRRFANEGLQRKTRIAVGIAYRASVAAEVAEHDLYIMDGGR